MSSDAALVLRARSGDELAFRRLARRYRGMIGFQASAYFAPGLSRADLLQEGLIGLHKAVRDYRRSRGVPFSSFAGMCIQRQLITAVKTATRAKHSPLNDRVQLEPESEEGDTLDSPFLLDEDADPQEIVARRDHVRSIAAAVRSAPLSELEAVAFDMVVEGFSYGETARELGCSEKTIDNALQRGRRKIVEAMPA